MRGTWVNHVALPKVCRRGMLEMEHSVPLAGRLGKGTTAHVIERFCWPVFYRDVANFLQ